MAKQVPAGGSGGRDSRRRRPGHLAGTSSPPCRTTSNPDRRPVMKRISLIAALSVLSARGVAAQDTTHAPPAAAPAAAAAPVTVVEAAVGKTVGGRQPQGTGGAFPGDVGQLGCWTKGDGAGGAAVQPVLVPGDSQVGGV